MRLLCFHHTVPGNSTVMLAAALQTSTLSAGCRDCSADNWLSLCMLTKSSPMKLGGVIDKCEVQRQGHQKPRQELN